MVSPADGWKDVDNGYVSGSTRVLVEPIHHEVTENSEFTSSVPESEANAYAVSIVDGSSGHGTHRTLVEIQDPRTAWEVANLCTHYLNERPAMDLTGLKYDPAHNSEPEKIRGVVTDLTPEEIMKALLGYDIQAIDHLL